MKKLIIILSILFFAGAAWAGTVTLNWNPNSETDLAGYRIYQDGVQAVEIACLANDATCCEWTSGELAEGDYSWYATAFDTSGNESDPSNTVTYSVDVTPPGSPQINITINLTVNP